MIAVPEWPENLVGYKKTREFSEKNVPAALLRDHATAAGVWGRLHVLEGSLGFCDQVTGETMVLSPGVHQCIYPDRVHHVSIQESVRFFVEFCHQKADEKKAIDDDPDKFPHRK